MTNILNLPNYHILDCDQSEHDYHIRAETAKPTDCCLDCGSKNIVGGGRQEIMIRDTPMHGRRVAIYVQARRFRCRDCGKTITERLPDVAEGQRMTQRLYAWICRKSLEKTHTSVALDVGISEGTVRQIFNAHIDHMAKQYHFVTPEWMGIDEIHILGQPRCVISNIETNTIVDMLEGRTKQLVVNYFMRLPLR